MKLTCPCGQSYLYDHSKAGQAFTCDWCKLTFAMPAFQSLSHEDQVTYRKELEKQQKKQQQQAEKEAARIQREKERIEHNQRQQAATVAPPALAHQASHPQLTAIKLSSHIRTILFNADILYAGRPAQAVLVVKLILCGFVLSPVLLFLLFGFMARGLPGPTEALFLLPIVLSMLAWPLVIYFSWKNQYYIITKERTIVARGIFNVSIRMVLNSQIQMVSINTGLIDSFLGVNGVELATSAQGGASGVMRRFPGMTTGSLQLKYVDVGQVLRCYEQLQG